MPATGSLLKPKFIRLLSVGITFLRHRCDLTLNFWRFGPKKVASFQRRDGVSLAKFDQSIDAPNGVSAFIHSQRPDQNLRIRRVKSLRQKKYLAFGNQQAESEVAISVLHDVTNILSAMSLLLLRAKRDIQTISARHICQDS